MLRPPVVDPARASTALMAALAEPGDPLGATMRTAGDLAGAPARAFWRRDGERLLLAHRSGDCEPDVAAAIESDTELDGAAAPGIPLELPASAVDGPRVMRLQGRPFAATPVAGGLMALGPLAADTLGRRDRERVAQLAGVCEGPVAQALRVTHLEAEITSLRNEVELHRRALGSTFDEERAFSLLLEMAVSSACSMGGFVGVLTESGLRMRAGMGLPEAFRALDLTPGRGIITDVPGIPGLLIVEDPDVLAQAGVDGLVAVSGPAASPEPRVIFGLVTGQDCRLADDCSALLTTLVEQAALVLESSETAREGAARHLAALQALCRALDARSPQTRGHHALVARAGYLLARRVGLPRGACRLVHQAALVHDAGLLAATGDAAIAAEYAHPEVGAEMAGLVPGAAALAPLIRAHHEWWDGFGFPQGLVGEAIPREARVLAAAEFYIETIRSDATWDRARLVAEVRARRGNQLDPVCADAMVTLIEEAPWS